MELRTLASGSSGNCILISGAGARLLVDCGISCRRIVTALRELDLSPGDITGILITHEHSDHIAGLATLTKQFALPVYASPGTALELRRRIAFPLDTLREVEPGRSIELEGLGVTGFSTSHDATEPMGFAFTDGKRRAAVVTDLGYVSDGVLESVAGADLVLCESNHDEDWLMSGPYPHPLKLRILGNRGHLSNEAGAGLALRCVEAGARTVLLGHLSAQNNTPARALTTAETVFRGAGIDPEKDITLAVAPRSEPSPAYEV